MKETIPVVIFVLHALVFAYFYFSRGRQIHNLLFFLGFVLIATFHINNGWEYFTGEESGADFLDYSCWAGLVLCGIATPLFVAHLVRKRRANA